MSEEIEEVEGEDEKASRYGPAIVELETVQARYTIKPDLGSKCWFLERQGKKGRPYKNYYPALDQAIGRLRNLALMDTSPSVEGAVAVEKAVEHLIAVGIRSARADLRLKYDLSPIPDGARP